MRSEGTRGEGRKGREGGREGYIMFKYYLFMSSFSWIHMFELKFAIIEQK